DEDGTLDLFGGEDRHHVLDMMRDGEAALRLRRVRCEEPTVVPRDDAVVLPECLDGGNPRVETAAEAVREDHRLLAFAEDLVRDARSVGSDDPSLFVRRFPRRGHRHWSNCTT